MLPIDDPPDLLYRLIVHELTHQFEFDIIPTSLIRRSVPLWVNEGLSDYMTGIWQPLDLMTIRDAAVTDIVPKMSQDGRLRQLHEPAHGLQPRPRRVRVHRVEVGQGRAAAVPLCAAQGCIGGGEDAYNEAFKISAEEFDQQFEKYLKDRFKAFRDKERPADYGRNLAPNPEKSPFNAAVSIEPSPSGELIAVATGNRKERELDIVLISAKDGSVIRNLTNGFDQSKGFEFVVQPGGASTRCPG